MKFGAVVHYKVASDVEVTPQIAGLFDKSPFEVQSEVIEKRIEQEPSFVASQAQGMTESGERVTGAIAFVPLTGRQMLTLPPSFVIGRIVDAINLLADDGCDIVALGAFTSPISGEGARLIGRVNTAITNGHANTVAMTEEALEALAEKMGIGLETASVSIVGATGSLGSGITPVIAKRLGNKARLQLIARHLGRLEQLRASIESTAEVQVATDIAVISESDLVLVLTSSADTLIKSHHLRAGTVVLDDTQPRNTDKALLEREDVMVVDGGYIDTPHIDFGTDLRLPKGSMYACIIEAIILALEGINEDYSIGPVDQQRVQQMILWGPKHGFHLSPFYGFEQPIPHERFAHIREIRRSHQLGRTA